MQLTITARHLDDSEGIKQHVHAKVERLRRFESRIAKIEVILVNSREEKTAEMIVTPRRGTPLVGRATHKDLRTSIDRLVDQMERRLAKRKSKIKEHRKGLESGTAQEAVG